MSHGAVLAVLLAMVGCTSKNPPATGSGSGSSAPPAVHATAAFVDVTVVPMDREVEVAHQTVLVDGDRIVAIGPTATTPVPAGATAIPGAGKWLIPGLVDMHAHFEDPRDGVLFVANGVTTIRNMWGSPATLALRERARKNDPSYVGPSIVTAGPILDGEPPTWPGSVVLHTAAEAEAEVAAEQAAGYDFMKVYDGLPLVVYDALAAAAKRSGMRFAGHLPRAVSLAHAIESGQASIEHLTGYPMEAQDASSKARTLPSGPEQRREVAAHVDAGKIAALAKQTADAKLANVPTLVVMARFAALDHPEALMARSENRFVSPVVLASWDPKQDFRLKTWTPADFDAMRSGLAFRAKLVKALADAGAPVLVGTDTQNPFVVPGFAIHEELGLLVGAGLTPFQALRGATVDAGAWIGDSKLGLVAVGARADLVLLDADPLKDIAATSKRAGVMVRGAWQTQAMYAAALDALAASYTTAKTDRFLGVAPLVIPDGTVELQATYAIAFAGADIGAERVVVVKRKDGGRTIVAQGVAEPPQPKLSVLREELDAKGTFESATLDFDNKHLAVTLAGKTFHVTGAATLDVPAGEDALLDGNLVANMIPFADRARAKSKGGAKVAIRGAAIDPDARVTPITYTFTPTGTAWPLTVAAPVEVAGTYEVDERGFPKRISVAAGASTIVVTRR